ncbi:MAG TPA: MarR family transcriptional regulator [Thermoanaerobaculia bacterium]|nr:MarR family transcriptional regulator [Thermoanaerobaculia bacterium]
MPPIQDEIKQTRPFSSRSEEAAVALMRTADMVRRAVSAVVDPIGLTVQQYNVLRILRGAGEHGLPTLEIADRMIEQTPGITRLIDRLEAKGLVSRERCLTDRRQVFCRITGEGLDLLERLDGPVRSADAAALESLGAHDLEHLIELLDKTRNAYRRIR